MSGPRRISVVMPVLNEAAVITDALRSVTELPNIDEVIVVDGGSSDATCSLVKLSPTVTITATEPVGTRVAGMPTKLSFSSQEWCGHVYARPGPPRPSTGHAVMW